MKKLIPILFLAIIFISFASANLGAVAQDQCMNIRVLANCTAVNLTEVNNKDTDFVINGEMSNTGGQTFNYTFCNTSTLGTYTYSWDNECVDCSVSSCGNSFEVTHDGNILNVERAILYLGLITILIFLFLLVVMNIHKLPSEDTYNEEGILLGVNNLKYLRSVFWSVGWGLLLGIMYITSSISIAYLPTTLFGEFFFMIFKVMFALTLPMFVVYFLYLFARIWRDREVKRMLERGVEFKATP